MTVQQPSRIGKYEVLSTLGEGGMGVVYKAKDPIIDRVVALKTIRISDDFDQNDLIARLRTEARSAGKLQHPNIVIVHDFGEQENLTYLVMEYVEGFNLARLIRRNQPIPFATKVDILIQLAQGLDYAHDLGVTHRDLKPANICVTPKGVAKILDFGLARLDATRLTKTGFTSGTVAYMSPERMRGDSGASDDIFALGAVAYEILTYKKAFPGTTYSDVVQKILSSDHPPPPSQAAELPNEIDPIILRALERDPKRRYGSAGEFAKALLEFRASEAFERFRERDAQRDVALPPLTEETDRPTGSHAYTAGSLGAATGAPEELEATAHDQRTRTAGASPDGDAPTAAYAAHDEPETTMRPAPSAPAPAAAQSGEDRTVAAPKLQADDATMIDESRRGGLAGRPGGDDATMIDESRRSASPPAPQGGSQTVVDDRRPQRGGDEPTLLDSNRPTVQRPPAAQPSAPADASGPSSPLQTLRTAVMKPFRRKPPQAARDVTSATVVDPNRGRATPSAPHPSQPPAAGATAPHVTGPQTGAARVDRTAQVKVAVPTASHGAVAMRAVVVGAPVLLATLTAIAGMMTLAIVIYGVALLAWGWIMRERSVWSARQTYTVAALLRLPLVFFPLAADFSTLRQIWDGRLAAAGVDIYTTSGNDPRVLVTRPAWFDSIPFIHLPSTLGPWAATIFMIMAWIGGSVIVWKLLVVLADLGTIWILQRNHRLRPELAVAWATAPPALLLGAWLGRIEVLLIPVLFATIYFARQDFEARGGLLAGIAVGSTVFAAPALPALFGSAERMLRMIVTFFIALLLPLLIFDPGGQYFERAKGVFFHAPIPSLVQNGLAERIEAARIPTRLVESAARSDWQPLITFARGLTAVNLASFLLFVAIFTLLIFLTKWSYSAEGAVATCLGAALLITSVFNPAAWVIVLAFAIVAKQKGWILFAIVTPLVWTARDGNPDIVLLATLYIVPLVLWALLRTEGSDAGPKTASQAA